MAGFISNSAISPPIRPCHHVCGGVQFRPRPQSLPCWTYPAPDLGSNNGRHVRSPSQTTMMLSRYRMELNNPDERLNLVEVAAEWLNREDAVNRNDRATRLAWMAERINSEEDRFEMGVFWAKVCSKRCDTVSPTANSLRLASWDSHGGSFGHIERTLVAYFYAAGRNDLQRATLSNLLGEAQSHGLIDRDQLEELERIRQTRNAYAHFRRPGHEDAVEYQAIVDDESFYGIIEQDATAVVEAALWISAQRPLS